MHNNAKLIELASLQGGVIRRDQAAASGLTRDQIDWRISTGEWSRVTNGCYRLFSVPGRLGLVRAAVSVLPKATVSHFSAAALHRIPNVSREIVSVTVRSKTTHAFPGVQVVRTDDLAQAHKMTINELPTTTLERTVLDLAAALKPRRVEFVVDELLAGGRCTVSSLQSVLEAVARKGKPGVATMRTILNARSAGDEQVSQLERAGKILLTAAGYIHWEREYPIPWAPMRRFDVAFPNAKLAIEWDSRRWHTQKQAFQNDRERDREAIEHGWQTLRFTWQDVQRRPDSVVETIRVVLEQRSALTA